MEMKDTVEALLLSPNSLTMNDEYQVFTYYKKNKSAHLRNKIALKNIGLVYTVTNDLKHLKMEKDDMEQEGFIGLLTAIDKFDPDRQIKFSTYAYFWIKSSITRHLVNCERSIRIPVHLIDDYLALDAVRKKTGKYEDTPENVAYLSHKTGYSTGKIKKLDFVFAMNENVLSLNTPIQDEEKNVLELVNSLPDKHTSSFDVKVEEKIDEDELVKYIYDTLTERQAQVICMRYGFKTHKYDMSWREIGEQLGISGQRASQLAKDGLEKLSTEKCKEILCAYL